MVRIKKAHEPLRFSCSQMTLFYNTKTFFTRSFFFQMSYHTWGVLSIPSSNLHLWPMVTMSLSWWEVGTEEHSLCSRDVVLVASTCKKHMHPCLFESTHMVQCILDHAGTRVFFELLLGGFFLFLLLPTATPFCWLFISCAWFYFVLLVGINWV